VGKVLGDAVGALVGAAQRDALGVAEEAVAHRGFVQLSSRQQGCGQHEPGRRDARSGLDTSTPNMLESGLSHLGFVCWGCVMRTE
jgi:hypothetical protein